MLHTPGLTLACCTYLEGDCAFFGDTLFMPEGGTGRADFPGGDAARLYRSIARIPALPPETRLFVCHDYQPGGREPRFVATVAEQRANDIHVGGGRSEAELVALRTARAHARDAGAADPLHPGRHPRRRAAAAGGRRRLLPRGADRPAPSRTAGLGPRSEGA